MRPWASLSIDLLGRRIGQFLEILMESQMIRGEKLRHEDADQFPLRIDPEAGIVETAPRVRPNRSHLVLARTSHNAKTVTEAVGWRHKLEVANLVARHFPDGGRLQNASAVPLAAVQEHLEKASVIGSARRQARSAGTVAALPPVGAGNAVNQLPLVHRFLAYPADALVRSRLVNNGETAGLVGRQIEVSVVHAERRKDPAARERFKILAGDHLDQPAQHVGGQAVLK